MKTRRPSLDVLEHERDVAVHAAAHVQRQIDAVRLGLERLARGRHALIRRAARKLLRTIGEVA